jgi:hypothetical protein
VSNVTEWIDSQCDQRGQTLVDFLIEIIKNI